MDIGNQVGNAPHNQRMKKSTLISKAGGGGKGVRALSRMLDVSTQAIYKWGDQVPQDRVEQLRTLRPTWFKPKRSAAVGGEG